MKLDQWLRKTPQPVEIKVDDKILKVPPGGGKWKDLARSIEALNGQTISALDEKGGVIRAMNLESEPEDAAAKPALESEIVVFARLLADAYEKANKGTQPILDNAMAFIERLSARLMKAESEIERLRNLNTRLHGDIIEAHALPAGGDDQSMIGAAISGMLQAQMGAPVGPQRVQPHQQRAPNGARPQKGSKQ